MVTEVPPSALFHGNARSISALESVKPEPKMETSVPGATGAK